MVEGGGAERFRVRSRTEIKNQGEKPNSICVGGHKTEGTTSCCDRGGWGLALGSVCGRVGQKVNGVESVLVACAGIATRDAFGVKYASL